MGCYNGLTPKVCGNLMSAIASQRLLDYLEPPNEDDFDEEPTDEQKYVFICNKYIIYLTWLLFVGEETS